MTRRPNQTGAFFFVVKKFCGAWYIYSAFSWCLCWFFWFFFPVCGIGSRGSKSWAHRVVMSMCFSKRSKWGVFAAFLCLFLFSLALCLLLFFGQLRAQVVLLITWTRMGTGSQQYGSQCRWLVIPGHVWFHRRWLLEGCWGLFTGISR